MMDSATLARLLAAGWQTVEGREAITKTYEFKGFRRAFAFMTAAAGVADRLNHHPEWSNVYGRVHVVLSTHDMGGLSSLDAALAQAMDQIAATIAAGPPAPIPGQIPDTAAR